MINENLNLSEKGNINKFIRVGYVSSIILAAIESVLCIRLLIGVIASMDSFEIEKFFFVLFSFLSGVFSIIIPILGFYKKNKLLCIFSNIIAWSTFFEGFIDGDIAYIWLIFGVLFLIGTIGVFKYNKEFGKVKLGTFDIISIVCFVISSIISFMFY